MRLFVIILITVILAGFGWMLAHLVPAAGWFVAMEPKLVDQCRGVDIASGTEDIAIDHDMNIAFISAADRRGWYNETGEPFNPKNGIYTLSLDGADTVTKVSPPMDNFLPHGISLWKSPNGEKRLFVVNHPTTGEEIVEIFGIGDNGALTHLDSISFDAMHSPNDVLAVGMRSFYATNDRGYEEGVMATLEAYMALPFSSVVYFDGEEGRIIKKGMTYANGINMSADGSEVYVAEFLKRRVAIFERDQSTGALRKLRSLKTSTGPDNIDVAEDGALWIGGHTKVFEFLKHAKDENAVAPSHVVRIDPASGESEDVFISTDGEINASSVAATTDDTLLVGAVFDGHVMVCPR